MITVTVCAWCRRNARTRGEKRVVVQSRHVYPLPPSLSAGNLWRGEDGKGVARRCERERRGQFFFFFNKKRRRRAGHYILYILIISLIPSYSTSLALLQVPDAPAVAPAIPASLLLLLLLWLYTPSLSLSLCQCSSLHTAISQCFDWER